MPNLYTTDPLRDPRWAALVARHPQSSIFHTRDWLESLRRAYGYEPIVFTTSPPSQELANGIVFCRIKSWLTGPRLVSLAFSDHCQPLTNSQAELHWLVNRLVQDLNRFHCRYIELRPLVSDPVHLETHSQLTNSGSFRYHELDLRPALDTLFQGLHKSCIQRKIWRAHKENLLYEDGRSDRLLRQFYSLLVLTRRRHGIVPQPFVWFRSLFDSLGDAAKIRVVSKEGQPIASIVTLHDKNCVIYKYGGSDAKLHRLGGMPLLLWRTIQDAKRLGAERLDLGRSDSQNKGLADFKRHLGAATLPLNYYRYPPERVRQKLGRSLLPSRALLPTCLSKAVGRILYRHIG